MELSQVLEKLKYRKPKIFGQEHTRSFAILIPLVQTEKGIEVLFEVRSLQMRSQPGDVCFPGGGVDPTDVSAKAAAIRETSEELGVKPSSIKNVTPLDYVIGDYGSHIYPFVGELSEMNELELNKNEVEEVFTVPLQYFMETDPDEYKVRFEAVPEDDFPFDLIQGGENYNWRPREIPEYFYQYEGRVIWGLTASMMRHFAKKILAEIQEN